MASSIVTCLLVAAVSTAALASAQKTYIVDANNGPGADYLDLPAAVKAANHGDVLVLRAGTYTPTTITKGIAILGRPGAAIRTGSLFGGKLTVTGVPGGQRFRMRGVVVQELMEVESFQITGNSGSVHLEEVDGLTLNAAHQGYLWLIQANNAVTLASCNSPSGCRIVQSNVVITGGSYHGENAKTLLLHGCFEFRSFPALELDRATVHIAQSDVSGGNGSPGCNKNTLSGSEAIFANSSHVVIAGPKSMVRAGTQSSVALFGHGTCSLVLDPTAQITGTHTGFSVTMERRPTIVVSGNRLGGQSTVEFATAKGDLFVLYASLSWGPVTIPGLGDAWLDPSYLAYLGGGVQGSSEVTTLLIPIPNLTVFRGLPVLFEGIGGPGLSNFRFTNAVGAVLDVR